MERNEFKIGDVVKLKSGSQKLTIVEVEHHQVRYTYWHEESNSQRTPPGWFDFALFQLTNENN